MCGIVGAATRDPFLASDLLSRLQRLAYRGYDSYGYAFADTQRKEIGPVQTLPMDTAVAGTIGIAHTRWATHGRVTRENAHPHRAGRVTLVHNGIIENYEALTAASSFLSETDSERLAARIDEELEDHEPLDAVREALTATQGIWAIAALIDGVDGIVIARKHVPLLVGKTAVGHAIASDARALTDATHVLALDDGSIALVTPDTVRCFDGAGRPLTVRWEENAVDIEETRPAGFAMEHEILQTPELLAKPIATPLLPGTITIIGCGSSVNAAGVALAIARSNARVLLASEYDADLDTAETVIAVSQSGETADVLDAVRRARAVGKRVVALVNAPHTTLTRLADEAIMLGAGEERCVAATKSVTLQIVALARLLGKDIRQAAIDGTMLAIADRDRIRAMARDIASAEHLFLIGRGAWLAVAQEAALKCKEVAYQHAESVPAFELKHGPLALITAKFPIVALGSEKDARLHSTIHEVEARDGRVSRLLFRDDAVGIVRALVTTQLLAFEIGRLRGTPIDKPRNLAKSVTVY